MSAVRDPARRARRWFWGLMAVAVLAMGLLYRAVSTPAGPVTALAVLLSGSVLALATVQAARILRSLRGPLVLDPRRLYQPADRR